MNDLEPDRRAELIAAALAGELTPEEGAELDALRADDPTIDTEFTLLAGVTGALPAVGRWDDAEPGTPLAARIAAIDEEGTADAPAAPIRSSRSSSRRRTRPLLLAVGAAACVGLGLGGGLLLSAPPRAVEGPPGTLGAVEDVDFDGAPQSVEIEGALVAHTWGTETVLTVEGLDAGAAFTVVVIGEDGGEFESGTFLGSTVPIDCRLNAAVLREDVAAVAIRSLDGGQIALAEVPEV